MWNIYLWPKKLLSAVSSITDMLQGISPDNISVAELCYKSLFFPHPLCSPAVEPALHSSGLLGKRSCSSTSPGSRCRAHLYAEFLSCHRHVSIHNTWDGMGNLLTWQLNSWMTFACGRIWQVRDGSGRLFCQPVAHDLLFSLVLKLTMCSFFR